MKPTVLFTLYHALYHFFAAVQSDKLVTHYGLHQLKGGDARAVSAIINSIRLCQLAGCLNDDCFFFLGVFAVILHHVEACYNAVRGTAEDISVSVKDIQYAVMGTP